MPASPTSLRVTDAYRIRLAAIVGRAERDARSRWPTIENFDQGAEVWRERTALAVTGGQAEAIRATAGYLGAYLTTETGLRLSPPPLAAKGGRSRDGRPLPEAYRSPIIGTLAALKEGKEPPEALSIGLNRAVRMVETDLMHAARESLLEGMEVHPRIEGWQRAVSGTCGACLGDIATEVSVQLPSVSLNVHPNCQCVTQPVVAGVPNRVPLATGTERFEQMPPEEQDSEFGFDKAEALRIGAITLAALVQRSPQATAEDFITERPLKDVQPTKTQEVTDAPGGREQSDGPGAHNRAGGRPDAAG